MIKKIMCFCGSGLGTSFVMEMNVKKALKNLGIEGVTVDHSTIDDVVPGAADLFICSADLVPNAEKAGKAIGAACTAMGAAIVAAGAAFLGLAEETREARENMGKLETSFTTAGHSAEDAKNTYTELYGVLGDDGQATEAAAHLA